MRTIGTTLWISLFLALSAQGQLVSSRPPDGLAVSTGNLYFTSHDAAGATVWRTSQTSVPGQESVLFWEAGARFGDIVFAQVNGGFFGFFFAQKGGVITIRRVPLTGGNAVVIATVTDVDIVNTHQNLATDGVNVYWQDSGAIRKVPVGGGAITVLDQTQANTPTAGIDLRNGTIIYASVNDIRFVPTGGATTSPSVRTIARASTTVTALNAGSAGVFWGERNGAVREKSGSVPRTLPVTSSLLPTSIASDGPSVAWTRCIAQCELVRFPLFSGSVVPIAPNAFGIHITPPKTLFWADAAGVHRRSFNQ
jgi:hypothetical protein